MLGSLATRKLRFLPPAIHPGALAELALTFGDWMTKLPAGGGGVNRQTRRELMASLENDAQRICARFRLRYRVLEAERANVKRRYGVCFSDGTIRIRLRHATTGKPLKYSSLVNTLCHELAHLRHFNHGQRFQGFYGQLLEWARREGIYRPGNQKDLAAAPTAATSGLIGPRQSSVPAVQTPLLLPESRATAHNPSVSTAAPARRPRPPIPAQLELFG